MTFEDQPAPAGASPSVPSVTAQASPFPQNGRFLGSEGAFFGLLVRGNFWMLLTLGIYRFWLTTDVRRFLWGNTEIAGDTLEYTGTAKELLIGFLLALVLLLPINALIYVGTLLDPALFATATVVGFVALTLIGQFAYFRARRYRLTRTIYRGVRFFQTGSAVRYAIVASLWFVGILLTLGLLYPWAVANLERYKLGHTQFGDLKASFVGSGTSFFFRGILIWLVVIGPLIAGAGTMLATFDYSTLAQFDIDEIEEFFEKFGANNPAMLAALGGLSFALVWSMMLGIILFPLYKAIETRWWISGVRFGPIEATSRLRAGQLYWVYFRFLLLSLALSTAFSAFAGLFAGLYYVLVKDVLSEQAITIVGIGLLGFAYVVFMLAYSVLYQATVPIRIWRLSFEMSDISNLQALDNVKAAGAKSGVFGEGLADALDVGGF